jgi:hypothetical protein
VTAMPPPVECEGPFSAGERSSVVPQLATTTATSSTTNAMDAARRPDVTACVLVLGWTAHAPQREGKEGRIPRETSVSPAVFRVDPRSELKKDSPVSPIPDVASVRADAATLEGAWIQVS